MGQAPPTAFPLTRMAPPGHRGLASVVSCAPGMTGHHPLAFPLFRDLQGPVAKPVASHLEEPESLNGCMEESTCCPCKPPGQQQEEWYTWTVPGLKLQPLLTVLEFKCVGQPPCFRSGSKKLSMEAGKRDPCCARQTGATTVAPMTQKAVTAY